MLTTPTVLVLGAGASVPFGFPTGAGLSRLVSSGLRPGNHPYNVLVQDGGFSKIEVLQFREEFTFSGKNSVDSFLEHRTDLMHIGKAATAAVLIGYENREKLFSYEPDNWLRYLYNNLNASFDEVWFKSPFNHHVYYDRSVETFLFEALKNTYKQTDAACKAALDQIPIIHLHGRLGFLPWQDVKGRPYTSHLDQQSLSASIEEIKIIHEDISDGRDKDFERAKQLMHETNRIVLMGFGYNRININRLGLTDLKGNVAIGTMVGFGSQERASINEACGGKISLHDGDCIHFVREFIAWR
jgi:hypothetical protein